MTGLRDVISIIARFAFPRIAFGANPAADVLRDLYQVPPPASRWADPSAAGTHRLQRLGDSLGRELVVARRLRAPRVSQAVVRSARRICAMTPPVAGAR